MTSRQSALVSRLRVLGFLLPSLIPLLIFWIYPILNSIWLSFTNWNFISPTYDFVFFENYLSILADSRFYGALWNTIVFTLGTIIPTLIGGLGLALLLHKEVMGKNFFKFALFSPWITPTVAISIVWVWIFEPKDGLANLVLAALRLATLEWIRSSDTAMLAVILVTVWKSLGYAMILYLSALEKVPKELYEANALDGANQWQRFRDVTLPLISPTTFFLIIITTINSLQAYDQIQVLTQGGPSGSTRTLLYMYYQLGFEEYKSGPAIVIIIVIILISGLLSYFQFKGSKRWLHYS
ncbi:carbohydrate ABC transporter permease [Streptococcus merionis]|uniref:Binding-protein-dependent transport system membrane protein n=1 Tax=Streptococcus merionis TaxID=400065 RepID=A0A239SN53_9STRE|nr:sugar ABC transporter permease [Streptococcus merionis]SNU86875.1 binding-protein-dependent transport system membrane protein [Streptococcus merionis]